MARTKGSKNKSSIEKTGKLLKDGSTPFTLGTEKTASINKEATGEYSVTQTQSFFYSPELTSDSWVLPKSRQEILKWSLLDNNVILTKNGVKEAKDIVVGDLVLSKFGKWQQIEKICKKFYSSKDEDGNEWTEIDASNIPSFTLSSYHPILAIKNPKPENKEGKFLGVNGFYKNRKQLKELLKNSKQEIPNLNPSKNLDTVYTDQELGLSTSKIHWVSPKNLERGDLLVFPKFSDSLSDYHVYDLTKYDETNSNYVKIEISKKVLLNEKLASLLGWYVAEGNTDPLKSSLRFTLSYKEFEEATYISNTIKELFPNTNVTVNRRKDKGTTDICVYSCILGRFFSDICGQGASNKRIPAEVMSSNNSILKAFLLSYLDGDGSLYKAVKNNPRLKQSMRTVSKSLAYQLFVSFSKLGILSTLQEIKEKSTTSEILGRKVHIQPYNYIVSINSASLPLLHKNAPKIKEHTSSYLEDADNFYLPIKSIKHYKKDAWGYDFRTTDHTYVAPVLVSNCRIFFNLEPYVQQITVMHSLYPFSKFDMVVSDPSIKKFYEEMSSNGDFNLFEFVLQASLSREKFGEAICFGNMTQDETPNKAGKKLWRWQNFILLEPELVEIKTDMMTGKKTFEMVPTEEIKALVSSTRPEDQERVEELKKNSPELVNAVLEHRNIKLDEECVSQIARITDPSATRGTSRIQSLFKALILQDWIRLAQSAYAKNYVFPKELWTIGDLASNTMPSQNDLNNWKQLINSSIQSPPFTIIAPPIVHYEPLSVMGKQFPLNAEYDYIQDQLLVGLGVNKNIILGEGPNFGNSKTMALQALVMQYKAVRDKFEDWMINKFFRPIAEKNEFYTVDPDTGEKALILPQISWYKSLDIDAQEREQEQFAQFHEQGLISTKTLFSKYPNLDYETERKQLEEERGTIFDKGSKDNRLPAKISRPSGEGMGGGGGDMGGGIGEPVEPTEPIEPTEGGAEGLPEAATEGTTEMGETNVGGASDLGMPEV